jgi:hypothetical protein
MLQASGTIADRCKQVRNMDENNISIKMRNNKEELP